MVKVCDAIMGSGKTSSVIAYINAHPEKRFLYITPYLPEAARIKGACPNADFVEPSDKIPEYNFSKATHTLALIAEGRNVVSTHQAAMYYTEDTIQQLKDKKYTIIIDEEVTILQKDNNISIGDINLMEDIGYIKMNNKNEYVLTDKAKGYNGMMMSHIMRLMSSRPLVFLGDKQKAESYYWIFSEKLFFALDDVIVLTYLFENSEMEAFLRMNNIPYKYIGIRRTKDGGYEFSDHQEYIPEYVSNLDNMVEIEMNERMNEIGKNRAALSMNWYKTNKDGNVDQLRKNLYNYFRCRSGSKSVLDRMCGTYRRYWGKIRAKGYWNSNVSFAQKATNEYRNRTVLAYPVNIFANGDIVTFYSEHGQKFDNDRYALATMVQWIWRSAIRDGKPIKLYVPSRRMRGLLTDWIKETKGAN